MTMSPFPFENARGRVLFVEDPSVFREMQSLLLRSAGYTVTACDQPEAALAEAESNPYDVAVLNSESANLGTPEFLNALRRHRPHIATIFVASALTLEVTRHLNQLGVTVVLQRPVNPTQLMEKIDAVLGLKSAPGPTPLSGPAPRPSTHPMAAQSEPFRSRPGPISGVGLESTSRFPATEARSLRPDSAAAPGSPRYSFSPVRSDSASPFTSSNALYRFSR